MSKSLKRCSLDKSDEFNNRKLKTIRKREVEKKLSRMEMESFLDDDDDEFSKFSKDPKFYRALIKNLY